jgi:hypothetical protein
MLPLYYSNSYKIKIILSYKSGSSHTWCKRPCIRQFDSCICCSGISIAGLSATVCYKCDLVHDVMTDGWSVHHTHS